MEWNCKAAGTFKPTESIEKSAAVMFSEVLKWSKALDSIRTPVHEAAVA